jgi:DNA polymerase elongation subunit (family B)
MKKIDDLRKIKKFLDGHNEDVKYLVNVELSNDTNVAKGIIHKPGDVPKIRHIPFTSFLYIKNIKKLGWNLYQGQPKEYVLERMKKYGITVTKLETGGQRRLENGYTHIIKSTVSRNSILNYLNEGGFDPYKKEIINGRTEKPNSKLVFAPSLPEQFFISTGIRLYKGFSDYNQVHRVTFDIETTGLRHKTSRSFLIGVRDNRGFEKVLEVEKINDDDSERELIKEFFQTVVGLKPAIVCGYNSEDFDFDYLYGRATECLDLDIESFQTTLSKSIPIKRRPNMRVKYGGNTDTYTGTIMWGVSVIDIHHAAKRTAAVKSDMKNTKLKYVCQFEDIAKPNRTYIPGEDGGIGDMYIKNNIFLIDENNDYIVIPEGFQKIGRDIYNLVEEKKRSKTTGDEYNLKKKEIFSTDDCLNFLTWFRLNAQNCGKTTFISGREIVRNYLLDDLWETEQVDELYNQSSFLLAKMVPTTYSRICTMGTAAIWDLLMTAWSYEHNLAIPEPDVRGDFSGGLARCYKRGVSKNIIKIDYGSLYPMNQLTHDIFPIFDISGVMKNMLLYLSTTRNIYKKVGRNTALDDDENELLFEIDHEIYEKIAKDLLNNRDMSRAGVKQLPIKILNNSLFGALGSNIAFKWSDNICAARITCTGRLRLRQGISWFKGYGLTPLLAVTDGINFQIPDKTNIKITDDGVETLETWAAPNEMWSYGGDSGVDALINKFNEEEMPKPYMVMDNDGYAKSCLNLSRINYATLVEKKDKKTGEIKEKIKLTGNTIKSVTLPEYIEDFLDVGLNLILNGRGVEFVEYYNEYVEKLRTHQIPLKKIASKSRVKVTIDEYLNRGTDKNGREKGKQAHMQLLILERDEIAEKLFEQHKDKLQLEEGKYIDIVEIRRLVADYMPPEPELDSTVYHYNVGTAKSHGNSSDLKDPVTKEGGLASKQLKTYDVINNPDLTGYYNADRYLAAFNSRIESILVGFDPEIAPKILAKLITKKGADKRAPKELRLNKFTPEQLELKNFDLDSYDESMHLEPNEVQFWKKYGYDPKKVWGGYKEHEDHHVHYEFYQSALDYVNQEMKKRNLGVVKAVDDVLTKGDYVLIKYNKEYNLGFFNGEYTRIVKENITIPKTDVEIRADKREEELALERKRIQENTLNEEKMKKLRREEKTEKNHFTIFKKRFDLGDDVTMEDLKKEMDGFDEVFEMFVKEITGGDDDIETSEDYYTD